MMETEVVRDKHWIVRPSGEIDLSNVDQFLETLDDTVAGSPSGIVLDLSQVDYMDSTGVYAILNAYRNLTQEGGLLVIATGNQNVRDILCVLHLEQFPGIILTDDLDGAREAMSSASAKQPTR